MNDSSEYAQVMERLVRRLERARTDGRRPSAVAVLALIRDLFRGEVSAITSRHIDDDNLEGVRMGLYENMMLYGVLNGGWGLDLLSAGPAPDDLDQIICRTLVDVSRGLTEVMDGYDLDLRAKEALATLFAHPVGTTVIRGIEDELGTTLVARQPPATSDKGSSGSNERIDLDVLVDAMFRRYNSFADYGYWTSFVDLALKEFGLHDERRGFNVVEHAFRELSDSVLPFLGALEVPTEVAMAFDTVPEWQRLQADVVHMQRKFMRALIVATDPTMTVRTCSMQSLREAGLREERMADYDDF
jgi:hypothetical protein